MPDWLPARVHRVLLPLAFRVRHYWRRWRKSPLVGCAVVITNPAGDVLLVRHSYGPDVWSLPGGGVASGEDPQAAARREVREELGLTLDRLETLGTREEEISGAPHTSHLFTVVISDRPKPDEREIVEARFFPSHSLPEPLGRVTRGRIEVWRQRGLGPAQRADT